MTAEDILYTHIPKPENEAERNDDKNTIRAMYEFAEAYHKMKLAESGVLDGVSYWVAFDWDKPETRPTNYGKYFVHRKDGKVHWETWNGSGWAYNGNVITYWMEVKPPCC